MTPEELTSSRKKLGLRKTELALVLKTPYRTFQDWEAGKRRIPGICQVAVELLLQMNCWGILLKDFCVMQNSKTEMTPAELAASRKKLGLNQTEISKSIKTPYRTYQDWEAGQRRIPGVCEVAVELLLVKDRWVMQNIQTKVEKMMDEDGPSPEQENL